MLTDVLLSIAKPLLTDRILKSHPWGNVAWQQSGGQRKQARLLLESWIQEGLTAERLAPDATGGWFDAQYYLNLNGDLPPELAEGHESLPLLHYLRYGWQEGRRPHPLFDPEYYVKSCIARGYLPTSQRSPLEHFLSDGAVRQISCTPLLNHDWFHGQGHRLQPEISPTLAELHPWGAAALALTDHDQPAAAVLLAGWQHHGLSDEELNAIACTTSSSPWPSLKSVHRSDTPTELSAVIPFGSHNNWVVQGWLAVNEDNGLGSWVLLKPGVWPSPAAVRLLLASNTPVRDPDPYRCRAWKRLGLEAIQVKTPNTDELCERLPARIWLRRASQKLGLPDPRNFNPGSVICLGAGSPEWNITAHPELWLVPGFDHLHLEGEDDHRALTAWLCHSVQQGCRLVRLHPDPSTDTSIEWLPIVHLKPFALTAEALLEELAWRDQGRPPAATIHTPRPEARLLWSHNPEEETSADAAVLISLYNYANRIERALDSVARQSLQALELLVVDDASTDCGTERVQRWMEKHGQRFVRAELWQHCSNSGLASARNTAFMQAKASWCMVLDADNALDPSAVETCLSMTQQDDPGLAVVHPLIRRQLETGSTDQTAFYDDLVSRLCWQSQHFAREGNHVDAMALIRRSAWQQVGGFHHIPGGWEDFDFWCCLIDAGYHGVLCPRPLATYSVHGDSMLQSQTNRHLRRLSRLLAQRHPWLHFS